MKRQGIPSIKHLTISTVLLAAAFLLSLAFFIVLVHEVLGEGEDQFDTRVFDFFSNNSSAFWVSFFRILTFFGSVYFLLPAYLILVVFLFVRRGTSDAIAVVIISISSSLASFGLKVIFSRPRPVLPFIEKIRNYSFPSGHALLSFIFFSILIYLLFTTRLEKKWKWILSIFFIVFALGVGISRVILRYHYATDVIGGFCLGFSWVLLSFWIQRKIERRVQMKKAT